MTTSKTPGKKPPAVTPGDKLGKPQRQHLIGKLIEQGAVENQTQLVELLAEHGCLATQATVSRDLDDLGAIKVRVPGGESAYAIPALPKQQLAPEDHLRRGPAATGWSRWRTPPTWSSCAPRPGRPTWWPRRSIVPGCRDAGHRGR